MLVEGKSGGVFDLVGRCYDGFLFVWEEDEGDLLVVVWDVLVVLR